ncbi:hypothetical protein IE81DRAFT_8881 [Ceraceosorus guamensis]|uniref:Uncharacterized protein n=1 Tax=Ceraceosorus guamensis TaxID=1522189 RepID=A0A316W3M9_9BASI|nr:hypothetical protein IE81DRAFT_8881 [Ceraceosorus guamensis]PWN44507.1 hypothetical protein IE81DRAFT_8881 [Ceraceosorus guamensis]
MLAQRLPATQPDLWGRSAEGKMTQTGGAKASSWEDTGTRCNLPTKARPALLVASLFCALFLFYLHSLEGKLLPTSRPKDRLVCTPTGCWSRIPSSLPLNDSEVKDEGFCRTVLGQTQAFHHLPGSAPLPGALPLLGVHAQRVGKAKASRISPAPLITRALGEASSSGIEKAVEALNGETSTRAIPKTAESLNGQAAEGEKAAKPPISYTRSGHKSVAKVWLHEGPYGWKRKTPTGSKATIRRDQVYKAKYADIPRPTRFGPRLPDGQVLGKMRDTPEGSRSTRFRDKRRATLISLNLDPNHRSPSKAIMDKLKSMNKSPKRGDLSHPVRPVSPVPPFGSPGRPRKTPEGSYRTRLRDKQRDAAAAGLEWTPERKGAKRKTPGGSRVTRWRERHEALFGAPPARKKQQMRKPPQDGPSEAGPAEMMDDGSSTRADTMVAVPQRPRSARLAAQRARATHLSGQADQPSNLQSIASTGQVEQGTRRVHHATSSSSDAYGSPSATKSRALGDVYKEAHPTELRSSPSDRIRESSSDEAKTSLSPERSEKPATPPRRVLPDLNLPPPPEELLRRDASMTDDPGWSKVHTTRGKPSARFLLRRLLPEVGTARKAEQEVQEVVDLTKARPTTGAIRLTASDLARKIPGDLHSSIHGFRKGEMPTELQALLDKNTREWNELVRSRRAAQAAQQLGRTAAKSPLISPDSRHWSPASEEHSRNSAPSASPDSSAEGLRAYSLSTSSQSTTPTTSSFSDLGPRQRYKKQRSLREIDAGEVSSPRFLARSADLAAKLEQTDQGIRHTAALTRPRERPKKRFVSQTEDQTAPHKVGPRVNQDVSRRRGTDSARPRGRPRKHVAQGQTLSLKGERRDLHANELSTSQTILKRAGGELPFEVLKAGKHIYSPQETAELRESARLYAVREGIDLSNHKIQMREPVRTTQRDMWPHYWASVTGPDGKTVPSKAERHAQFGQTLHKIHHSPEMNQDPNFAFQRAAAIAARKAANAKENVKTAVRRAREYAGLGYAQHLRLKISTPEAAHMLDAFRRHKEQVRVASGQRINSFEASTPVHRTPTEPRWHFRGRAWDEKGQALPSEDGSHEHKVVLPETTTFGLKDRHRQNPIEEDVDFHVHQTGLSKDQAKSALKAIARAQGPHDAVTAYRQVNQGAAARSPFGAKQAGANILESSRGGALPSRSAKQLGPQQGPAPSSRKQAPPPDLLSATDNDPALTAHVGNAAPLHDRTMLSRQTSNVASSASSLTPRPIASAHDDGLQLSLGPSSSGSSVKRPAPAAVEGRPAKKHEVDTELRLGPPGS